MTTIIVLSSLTLTRGKDYMRELGVHHHDTESRAYFTIKRRQPNYPELCIFATLGRKFLRIFQAIQSCRPNRSVSKLLTR